MTACGRKAVFQTCLGAPASMHRRPARARSNGLLTHQGPAGPSLARRGGFPQRAIPQHDRGSQRLRAELIVRRPRRGFTQRPEYHAGSCLSSQSRARSINASFECPPMCSVGTGMEFASPRDHKSPRRQTRRIKNPRPPAEANRRAGHPVPLQIAGHMRRQDNSGPIHI